MSLILASFALSSVLAQAIPSPPSVSASTPVAVTITAGRGSTWDDEGSIGRGTAVGGGVEWRFRPRWSAGGEVGRLGHDRDTPGLRFSGRTVFATANIAYHFAVRGVSPYVGGGFGGAFYNGELVNRFGASPQTIQRSSASTVGYGTAGVEVPIGDRFALSPEMRISFLQPQDDFAPWSAIRFGVKAAVRF
jgi:Outer membrane protein beta-barrel domain